MPQIGYFSPNLNDFDFFNSPTFYNFYDDNNINYGRFSNVFRRPRREANIHELTENRNEDNCRVLPGRVNGIVTLNDYKA